MTPRAILKNIILNNFLCKKLIKLSMQIRTRKTVVSKRKVLVSLKIIIFYLTYDIEFTIEV